MKISEKAKTFLEKLQNYSEAKKKTILWTIVVIIGLPLVYLWINSAISNLSKIGSPIQLPQIPATEIVPKMPSLDILQTSDLKVYTNDKYGVTLSYPNNWNAGISILFPNVVLFCPPELASADPDVICKMKEGAGHADTQAPITFSLVQKKLQLVDNNSTYAEVFNQMEKSLNSIK